MAVIHKRKRRHGRAQLKVRLPEELRREIELAAAESHHSMNTEIVRRLKLFGQSDPTKLAAQALFDGLDRSISSQLLDMARRSAALARGLADQHLADLPKSDSDIKKAKGGPHPRTHRSGSL